VSATGTASCEDAAMIAGVDLTSREFWCEGLASIAKQIDEFCKIVEK
jgi:oligoendopeptidase F